MKLENEKELQNIFTWNRNEISRERFKSKQQTRALKNIKIFYESRQTVIKLFSDYSSIASEVKHKEKYAEGLKILSPKQMLQRLLIILAQVKAGNTSENLLNELRQILYFFVLKKILKKYITM